MNKSINGKEKEIKNEMNKWTGNGIGAEGASKISETLKVNTTLTVLNLSGVNKNKELKGGWNENEMNKWTGNGIGDSGARKISESLKVNTTLTELDLGCDE